MRLDGRDITKMAPHLRVRDGVAYVPQGRIVIAEMTVLENLELGGFTLSSERAKLAANMERVLPVGSFLSRSLTGRLDAARPGRA